jgi:hypothetical protein
VASSKTSNRRPSHGEFLDGAFVVAQRFRCAYRGYESDAKAIAALRRKFPKVAFIGILTLESTEKSPQGHVYPTRSRQIVLNGQVELVRKFYVDFEAPLPDELFQPLK